jgi:hypothetical protein
MGPISKPFIKELCTGVVCAKSREVRAYVQSMAEDTEITRRKFTLSPSLDAQLIRLADEHYQGNKSLFLRSAINDHERTLEDKDEFVIKELQKEVEEIAREIEELKELVEDISVESSPQTITEVQESADSNSAEIKRSVQSCLLETDEDPLTLEEITINLEAGPLEVQTAVDDLLNKEFIESDIVNGKTRYQINRPEV